MLGALHCHFQLSTCNSAGFDSFKMSHFVMVAGSEVSIADLIFVKTNFELTGPIILL